MKRLIQIGVILCSIFLVVACGKEKVKGSGHITTQSRVLTSFNHISANGLIDLQVTANQSQSVTVTTDNNIQPYVMLTVNNGTLQISTKRDYQLLPSRPIQVVVSAPKLKSIATAGAVKVSVAKINDKTFGLHCSGYSQTMLAGEVDKVSIGIDGAGEVDARKLEAKEVNLDVTGSGKAMVSVSKKLNVKISGTGRVTYYGKPPIINQAVFGDGKIQKGD